MEISCFSLRGYSDLPLQKISVETPLCRTHSPLLSGKKLALVSILRAGNGLLDGILELIPAARVGFVGLYRVKRLEPVEYYCKIPDQLEDRLVIAVDSSLPLAIPPWPQLPDLGCRCSSFACLVYLPHLKVLPR